MDHPGRDLETMGFAVRYQAWIRHEFAADVADVDAGDGAFRELLPPLHPR